ncbi:hypothetical protein, partial [Shigella sp. FC1967]
RERTQWQLTAVLLLAVLTQHFYKTVFNPSSVIKVCHVLLPIRLARTNPMATYSSTSTCCFDATFL